MTPARILIVEDDRVVARDIQQQLERIGHTVVGSAARGDEVLSLVRVTRPTLVLMDIRLEGDIDGIAAAKTLRAQHPVPVVFLTAYADEQTVKRASGAEPLGYLVKPFDDSQLRTTIELALYKHAADQRLRESEQRYAVTLASIADAVIASDAEGRITFMNPVATTLTGWAREDGIGRRLDEVYRIVDDETDELLQMSAEQVIRLGTTVGLAKRTVLLARDGTRVPVEDSIAPMFDETSAIKGSVLVFRDTSQRRLAEEAEVRQRTFARLELAVRGSDIAIWEFDFPDGNIENCTLHSTNFLVRHGVQIENMRTWPQILDSWHPDDRARLANAVKAFIANDALLYEQEARFATAGGGYRNRLARGVRVRDATGKTIRMIGSSIDITERREIEEALRVSEARYRSSFEQAPLGLVHASLADLTLLRVNQTYLEMTGYTEAEALSAAGLQFLHADDRDSTIARFTKVGMGELVSDVVEFRMAKRNGEWMWMRVTASLGRDASDALPYMVAVLEDVSERHRLESELKEAKEAAEASNRAKDEFLANVSHEIRTPMNAILGMTELVLDTRLEEGQRQSLRTVQSAASNLLALINDLLDFSKIEAGKVQLSVTDFGLRALIGDTMRALAVRAHRKGIELLCNISPDTPDALVGDAGRLRQVLLNLVGNAIKFTEQGEVQLDVSPIIRAGNDIELQFSVRDTGIGIPLDKQASIFRAFEQEDMSTTRRYGGTGLGLTIAASIVEMMGGRISVESRQGSGSTFSFDIRLRWRDDDSEPGKRSGDALSELRVLIVDDNAANREIMERWLRGWLMDPTAVPNGLAAMDALWHAVASKRPYSLILLDARMPDTDGLSLAATIRDRAELAGTRIILLTSGDRPNDLKRLRELRIEAEVLKPVPQEELLATIHEVMTRPTEAFSRVEPTPVQIASEAVQLSELPQRVLVAEDNPFNSQLLQQLLASRGHAVRIAQDGRTALEYAKSGAFDLLLLDLHMPELDGFQVLEALREHERTTGGHLPVIALTARSRAEDRARCFAAGSDDFLSKPISAANLWTAVDRITSKEAPARSLLSPEVLLAAVGSSAAVLAVVRDGLTARLPAALASIAEALSDGDAVRLREGAHSVSGMLSAFSTETGSIASALEEAAAANDLDAARGFLTRLRTLAPELLRAASCATIETLRSAVQKK
ncbi:MAG TPA: response regulator [Kofleriaceae bacterium]|jgi:PAS domain S-box-containing protein